MNADPIVRLANQFWVVLPARALRRFPAAWGVVGDGHLFTAAPPLAVALPMLVAAGGFAVGAGQLGYDQVYTESLVFMCVAIAIGCLSTQSGLVGLAGFIVGEFFFAYPSWSLESAFGRSGQPLSSGLLGNLARVRLPLIITYLLLSVAVLIVPRTARSLVGAVGRRRRLHPALTWAVASGLYVGVVWIGIRTWAAAAPTLVRPRFTWLGRGVAPTAASIQVLQNQAGKLVAAAVTAALVRQAMVGLSMLPGRFRDRARAAEELAASIPAGMRPPPTRLRRLSVDAFTALLATLTLAGVLEHAWLWALAFGLLLFVRLLRSEVLAASLVRTWKRTTARLPAAVRLIALWVVARVVTDALTPGVIDSYTAMALFVLAGVVAVFVVFPGMPPRTARPDRARPAT